MIALPVWKRHLSDERLLDCYLADCGGEGIEPRAAEHLADCPACDGRYAELATMLTDVRDAGQREADNIFSADRLRVQQETIAERLRLLGHAGRVINFPAHVEASSPASEHARMGGLSRVAAGWVAAAAAAGIFIGVSAGRLYDGRQSLQPAEVVISQPSPVAATTSLRVEPSPVDSVDSVDPVDDDALLMSELEAVRDRPRTEELMAFDALTPHVREINYRVR